MKQSGIFQCIFSTCFQSHRTSRKQSRDKKPFFPPFKKVTFSVSRILNAKTTKSDVFLTHFLNIDFIWGKSRFLKIVFLPFVSSMKIHDFHWKYCLSVLWWFWDFQFFPFSACFRSSKFYVLKPQFYKKSFFETKKHVFFIQIRIYNSFLSLISLKRVLWTSKCHFWNVEKSDPKWNFKS